MGDNDFKFPLDDSQIWVHGHLIKLGPLTQSTSYDGVNIRGTYLATEECDIPFNFEVLVAEKILIAKIPLILFFGKVYSRHLLEYWDVEQEVDEGMCMPTADWLFVFDFNRHNQTIRLKMITERLIKPIAENINNEVQK
jgi:hypothetical protein